MGWGLRRMVSSFCSENLTFGRVGHANVWIVVMHRPARKG